MIVLHRSPVTPTFALFMGGIPFELQISLQYRFCGSLTYHALLETFKNFAKFIWRDS